MNKLIFIIHRSSFILSASVHFPHVAGLDPHTGVHRRGERVVGQLDAGRGGATDDDVAGDRIRRPLAHARLEHDQTGGDAARATPAARLVRRALGLLARLQAATVGLGAEARPLHLAPDGPHDAAEEHVERLAIADRRACRVTVPRVVAA